MVGLDFDKPINELKDKIQELKDFSENANVDLSTEIEKLEIRLKNWKKMYTII